jgi:hypothetical protein
MPDQLVGHFLRDIDIAGVMRDVGSLCEHDRYQASLGIERAAALVAERARAVGLDAVTIQHFPADGARRWWSFRAPMSWTPSVARLCVDNGRDTLLDIDHACQPFSIATYSGPTPAGGARARLVNLTEPSTAGSCRGAIAVVDRARFVRSDVISELAAHGALGFVTDATARTAHSGAEAPGRIELPPGSRLFAFSVTPAQLHRLRSWAEAGYEARATVVIDETARMPVVTGVIPGEDPDGEVWLTSHLCHPRPGANDNASGSAGLLEVARLHYAARRSGMLSGSRKSIRFLWGPEFLGVAAYLHHTVRERSPARLPSAVINLDMIGEHQGRCGSPFLVERCPDFIPSLITPLAEHLVEAAFQQTTSEPGIWRAEPFVGFSDHALFAAPDNESPAVQFCHVPDSFNHSAADTIDQVCPVEMARSISAAAALARFCSAPDAVPRERLRAIVHAWTARQRAEASDIARGLEGRLGPSWAARYVAHVDAATEAILAQIEPWRVPRSLPLQEADDSPRVAAAWRGPFNARAMMEDVSSNTRAALHGLVRESKMTLALLLNFALRSNGSKRKLEVIDETSFALRRPLEAKRASFLFDSLLESGWVVEVASRTTRS